MDRSGSWCNTFALIMSIMVMVMLSLFACGCTCLTIETSDWKNLTQDEEITVYTALQDFVTVNDTRMYYRGRIFSKYINGELGGMSVVLRFTRWSSECSITMSGANMTIGSELLEAFRFLVPVIADYALKGYDWVAVSNHTYWIDYFVKLPSERYEFRNSPWQSRSHVQVYRGGGDDTRSGFLPARILSSSSSSRDCGIKTHMLLSHYDALSFNTLYPGEKITSPGGTFTLSLEEDRCNAVLLDVEQKVVWSTNTTIVEKPQNCALQLRTDGILCLTDGNHILWNSGTNCSISQCAGTASLAVEDAGKLTIFVSTDDHLHRLSSFP